MSASGLWSWPWQGIQVACCQRSTVQDDIVVTSLKIEDKSVNILEDNTATDVIADLSTCDGDEICSLSEAFDLDQLVAEEESLIATADLASFARADDLSGDELIIALTKTYLSVANATRLACVKEVPKTKFDSTIAPQLRLDSYMRRLRSYGRFSDACFVTSLVYIERISKLLHNFVVTDRNIHRLIATTVVLSIKFHEDDFYSNAFYGRVCGLSVKDLNMLEITFLQLINWKIQVTTEEYQEAYSRLCRDAGRTEGRIE